MKVVSTDALTKLIQLVKSAFIKADDVVSVTEIDTETPQEVTLATVATSGDYDDLSNKPTIPTVNDATLTIQKNGSNVATFTANASSNVTANISVPVVTDTYTATGTDAVSGKAVSNAIATKQDNLVSGTNIKTINNQSILGEGNIEIQGGGSSEEALITISSQSGTISLEANKIYCGSFSGDVTFSLPSSVDTTKFNQIKIIAQITNSPTINLGTSYFFNKQQLILENGYYDLYFDYDNNLSGWVCGAISKGSAS